MSRTIPSYRNATEMEGKKRKYSGRDWALGKEDRRNLRKCFPIHDCTIQRIAMLADLGGITASQDLN